MSSAPKRFTRYEAEYHDPATEYVLADVHDATARIADTALLMQRRLQNELADAKAELALERMRHAATRAHLEAAQPYPVFSPTNPVLTVESGGIRYVLEAMDDEDGEWFEVKNATPTEPMSLEGFGTSADGQGSAAYACARKALAAYRAAQCEDDEASRVY